MKQKPEGEREREGETERERERRRWRETEIKRERDGDRERRFSGRRKFDWRRKGRVGGGRCCCRNLYVGRGNKQGKSGVGSGALGLAGGDSSRRKTAPENKRRRSGQLGVKRVRFMLRRYIYVLRIYRIGPPSFNQNLIWV